MMKEKKNFLFNFSLKTALFFAFLTFIIVISGAIFHRVEFSVLLKRLIIGELFFIPMGYSVGLIIGNIIKNIIVPNSEGKHTNEIENDKQSKSENTESHIIDKVVGDTIEEETTPEISSEIKVEKEEKVEDIQLETPVGNYTSATVSNDSENKDKNKNYIIVNDKKIVNDPEVLAKAVKTIMEEG